MRTFIFTVLFIFSVVLVMGQGTVSSNLDFAEQKLEEKGEFYFTFRCDSRSTIVEMSDMLSFEKQEGTLFYAYANSQQFEQFLEYGFKFEPVHEYYNNFQTKALTMATTTAEMSNWDRYPTHAVYLQMLDDYVATYPSICRLETIGDSENGIPLMCLVISDNVSTDEDEPEYWWSGTMHGDELVAYVITLRFADYLLTNYGSVTQVTNLVDNVEIYVNVLANPDGTFNGSPGLTSVSNATRNNTNNVDLNRNFPKINGDPVTIDAEIQIMMDFADIHSFVMSSNSHSGIELVNYPWDNWTSAENIHPDDNWWQLVSWKYATPAQNNSPAGYFTGEGGVTEGADWYYAYGTRQDYFNYFKNIRETTLEWSDEKLLDASDLPAHWDYNRQAMLDYTEQVLYGFRGIVTDACTGIALSGVKVEIVGHDHDNTEIYSSAPVGNYHRPIYEGTYDVTFSITGYADQIISVSVTNDNSTRLDVQLIPDGVAVPDFTASSTSIFEGQTVDYTDATVGAVTSRAWTFEGGVLGSSTVINPAGISYATAGTYDVTLEVVSGGCTISELKTDYIAVAAAVPVVTDFVADATNVPQGTTVNFTDLSVNNPDDWVWTFDGGTPGSSGAQHPSIVYNTPGIYTVILTAENTFGGTTETKTDYIAITEADLLMSNGTSTRCSGLFKDSGGDANYQDNETYTHTIYPSTVGAFVRITFTELNIEPDGANCYDDIAIYDGEDATATHIGTYCGTDHTVIGTGGVVTASNVAGALTFVFNSDTGVTESGWEAEISCYSPTDPPVAGFSADVTSTCTGIVQFADESLAATSWAWDFGDGNISSEQHPLHTYTLNGTYTVLLEVFNAYGDDTHEITDYIVVDQPVAPITTGAASCGPASLSLLASGSGTLAWYDAAIGGSEINTGTGYTTAFATTTTYYVQSEIDNSIHYSAGKFDDAGAGGYYTNATQHGLIFDAYQDFTIVSVFMYSDATADKTITLKNSADVTIAEVTVNVPTGGARVDVNIDVPTGTDYTLLGPESPDLYRNSGGTAYPYNVDGVLSIYDNTAGNLDYYYYFYDWDVMISDVCVSSRTPVMATINDIPTVELGAPVTQCGGTVELDAGSGLSSYTWNGTLGTQTYTATTTNTYTVVVENAAGCTATDNVDITINSIPAVVSVTGGGMQCGGSMTLTADNGGDGTIYWQNTNSGGTSTATASTSEIVSTSGTYYFRSQSAEGCWGGEGSDIVTINDVPATVIVSGGGTQCGGSMTLTADNGGDGTIYWQNTNSGGMSTAIASTSETVSLDGTYYFRARSIEGCWGNEGSAIVVVEDNTFPTASNPIAINVECIGNVPAANVAVVTDEADDCTVNPIVAHVSDISDGNTCPETITRTYSVSDDVGNIITVSQTIIINDTQNPTASNLPPIFVANASAVPVANTSDVTDEADNCTISPIVTFVSDVSDVNTCPELITRTYAITDDCGNSILITQIITINSTPAAVIVSGGGTQCGGSMTLTADNGGDGTIYWQNTTSGGTSTSMASTSEIVSSSGTYYFRAQSSEGCWSPEGSTVIAIYPTLSASATAIDETGVGNNDGSVTVDMIGGTPDYDGVWTSGAPTNTSGTSMTQSNLTGGYYQVTVTDANGCTAVAGATVNTAGAEPVADFTADNTQVCDVFTVIFEDLSNNSPTEWLWLFGDDETSDQENPIHTYSSVGIYTVSLEVTNADGSDVIEFENYISVGETPELTMSMTEETVLGNDGTASVDISGGTMPYLIDWSNLASGVNTISGLSAGEYCVIVQESYGCTAAGCVEVSSNAVLYPPVANFEADELSSCETLTVQFTDLSSNAPTEWAWIFGDGEISDQQNPEHTYINVGIYTVSLVATNADGSNEIIFENYIEIFSNPSLSFDVTPESGAGMNDGEILLIITEGQDPFTINWSTGSHEFGLTDLAAGVYSVAVIDDNGCMSTDVVEVPLSTFIRQHSDFVLDVFPNPSNGVFEISSNSIINNVELYDALGRLCYSVDVNSKNTNISVDLPSGVYTLKIKSNDKMFIEKIVIKE